MKKSLETYLMILVIIYIFSYLEREVMLSKSSESNDSKPNLYIYNYY